MIEVDTESSFSQIAELEESMKTLEEEARDLQSQDEQVQLFYTSAMSLRMLNISPPLTVLCLSVSCNSVATCFCPGTNHSKSLQYEQRQAEQESGNSWRGEHTVAREQRSGEIMMVV